MIIHHKPYAVVADSKEYPHDGTIAGRRAAIHSAQQDASLAEQALTARSMRERGHAPTAKELQRGSYDVPETRGPMEMECDRIAQTSAFNPYSARLDIIRSQRVNSREVEALTAKAAAWTAPVVAPDSSVNHFASAIASLEAKPGNTPAERASTQRQVDLLRTAESKWLDEQAREAAAEARAARPEYINAVENSAAVAAYLANVATAPQSLVTAAHERAKALKASGDVDAYWRDTRAAEKALDQHYTDIENKFDEEKKQHEADKAAALSRLPVAPVVEAPPPTPSVIESTLMGGSISPEVTT